MQPCDLAARTCTFGSNPEMSAIGSLAAGRIDEGLPKWRDTTNYRTRPVRKNGHRSALGLQALSNKPPSWWRRWSLSVPEHDGFGTVEQYAIF